MSRENFFLVTPNIKGDQVYVNITQMSSLELPKLDKEGKRAEGTVIRMNNGDEHHLKLQAVEIFQIGERRGLLLNIK